MINKTYRSKFTPCDTKKGVGRLENKRGMEILEIRDYDGEEEKNEAKEWFK